jgi:uncharacterized YigZ family protein
LIPSSQFEQVHARLKKEHPKARHIVWAKRELNEYDQIVENCSDDGEPKGTSGPPTLNVLRGTQLIDTAVLIVRYFGGIKLGTGGLVRAYSSACNEVIGIATLVPFEKKMTYEVEVTYPSIQFVEHKLANLQTPIITKEFGTQGASIKVEVAQSQEQEFLSIIEKLKFEGVKLL